MGEEEDNRFFRKILKEEYESIFDDEVLELLEFFNNYEQINKYKNYKHYGRKLIKYEREW